MSEEQYLSRIKQLEKEIEYLHGLLDEAGISYKREAKDNCGECKNHRGIRRKPCRIIGLNCERDSDIIFAKYS